MAAVLRFPLLRAALVASLVALFALAVPATATAEDQAAVNKVTNLNKKALEAYQKQDYETARELLKQALELCASAGLDKHPIRARTHIHFGVVAIVGFQQREVGLKQFRKALDVQPDIKLTKSLVTPELQDAFEEAVLAAEGGGAGGGKEGGGETAGGGEGGGAGPVADDEGGGERKPTIRRPPPPKKKGGEDEDDKKIGQKGVFFISLTGGTSFGLVKGEGEQDAALHKVDAIGAAPFAPTAQVTPEFGFFLNPDLLLSLQARVQYVGGLNGKPPRPGGSSCTDNFCDQANGAFAAFARVTYLALDAPFHLTIGGQIGGGNIRHALEFKQDTTCRASATDTRMQTCMDTLAGGPFLVGPTVGMLYEIGDSVDFILGVNTALGVPHFTFNFDVGLGIGFRI
jgi:hypothetical protein